MNDNDSFLDIIKKPATELITDAAELGIDELIDRLDKDHELLKNIPIIKWMFLGHTIISNLHLSFFVKKYALFIGPINKDMPEDFWDDHRIDELVGSKEKFKTLIEETIVALERYQAANKARLLGVLFVKTFKEMLFTVDEYNTLLFSIELMHPHQGIDCLRHYYNYKMRMDVTIDVKSKREIWREGSKLDFSPLATTCLIQLPRGGTSAGELGGAHLNALGKKFYEEVVSQSEVRS